MAEQRQEDKLMRWTFRDQHGREFAATVDRTGYRGKPRLDGRGSIREPLMGFVSDVTPIGWAPPFPELLPATAICQQDPAAPSSFVIDYDAWASQITDAYQEYERGIRLLANERYPSNPGEALTNPPADLLRLAGRRPLHPDFVIAMRQGNRWALGLPRLTGGMYPTPAWATPLLDTIGSLYKVTRASSNDAARFADEDEVTESADWTEQAESLFDAKYADEEDEADPHAVGGTRVPIGAKRNAVGNLTRKGKG